MRMLRRVLAILAVILILSALGVWAWLKSLEPDYSGELRLPGLKAPVEVVFDEFAVPHIRAQDEEDLFIAFGYLHARDRLFQMEVIRRLGSGRLAEVFGEKALASDRLFRTLSFRQHAERSVDSMQAHPERPHVKAAMAYLRGVNHYIATGATPVEFTLAGIPKTPFEPEDMEVIVSYIGYTFTGAFRTEPIATAVAEQWGMDHVRDAFANWPDSAWTLPVQRPGDASRLQAAQTLAEMTERIRGIEAVLPYPSYKGSNGWVISGKKTKSGKPILANDTHIAFAQPSVWYEAHLTCPGYEVYGNFIAGTPVPALGHSPRAGWGITMFENDDMDFYREKANPADSGQVWFKDHWEKLVVRKDTIRVKGGTSVVLEVRSSRHGPILNGAFDGLNRFKEPIAMWWVHDQFPSTHLQMFYELSHAGDAAEAAVAVQKLSSPGLNIMWADTLGNIAWWAAGKLPVRPGHVNPSLILDGSTGNDDPTGWLPFSQNPQILNPERGVLYTANNQPDDMGAGLVPGYYVPSNRARRIEELLYTEKSDWTEAAARDMINDITCPTYPDLIRNILPAIARDSLTPEASKALGLLGAWNGRHGLDDVEPTIYYRFLYMTYRRMLLDELGHTAFRAFEHSMSLKRNTTALLQNDSSRWWDDKSTPRRETRREVLTAALNEAVAALQGQLGRDLADWQWKRVHFLEHRHPLGILPLVGSWFSVGPFPAPGGQETINNLDFPLDSTGVYKVISGPALRRIVDFGEPGVRFSVNPTGQSGHLTSPHYDDQARLFVEGGKRREYLDRKEVELKSIGKMVLKP
jgi:penicillin amidase